MQAWRHAGAWWTILGAFLGAAIAFLVDAAYERLVEQLEAVRESQQRRRVTVQDLDQRLRVIEQMHFGPEHGEHEEQGGDPRPAADPISGED